MSTPSPGLAAPAQLTVAELLESLMDTFAVMASEDVAERQAALAKYAETAEQIAVAVTDDPRLAGLQDLCVLLMSNLHELIAQQRALTPQEVLLFADWPGLAAECVAAPGDPVALQSLLDHMRDTHWAAPLTEEEAVLLADALAPTANVSVDEVLSEDVPQSDAEQMPDVIPAPVSVPASWATKPILSPAQQELIDLLRSELAEIIETPKFTMSDSTAWPYVMANAAEQAERIGVAAEMVGLQGLCLACQHFKDNFTRLSLDPRANTSTKALLEGWPVALLGYLQDLSDVRACEDLVQCLQDPAWPAPLAADAAAGLAVSLTNPAIVTTDESAPPRPSRATAEDVSLEVPGDVDTTLLEAMLQELPAQSEEFSAAIHHLLQGGFISDVVVAQRIAHTLKGAGNVVGVRGIANLTHHLEDILEIIAKGEVFPPRALIETLIRAADCLETMSESLLGMSDPPEDAVAVLQEVLDWANRIDREGVPTEPAGTSVPEAQGGLPPAADSAGYASVEEVGIEGADTAETRPAGLAMGNRAPAEAMLKIPARLADELFRLAGEGMIATGQLLENIRRTSTQGDAVQQQNQRLLQLSSELEELVDVRGFWANLSGRGRTGGLDALELNQYNELHTFTHRLVEATTDAVELIRQLSTQLVGLEAMTIEQGRMQRENQEAVMKTRMVPVGTMVPRLKRGVRQACRLTGKDVELTVRGGATLMDSELLDKLIDPLMHLLRNAVDHGIESTQARKQQGKGAIGNIDLLFARQGDQIKVTCRDDGGGLDYEAVKRKAEQQGLITSGQPLSEDMLNRMILTPGFSTRDKVSQVSGRGIGMDAVSACVREMKGTLTLASKRGQGMRVELAFPVTLLSAHALLVRVGRQMIALSNRAVEEILYPGAGKLQHLGARQVYQLKQEVYSAEFLSTMLSLDTPSDIEGSSYPALLVRNDDGSKKVVLVEAVLDTRDLVVKPLGRYTPKVKGVMGATILGDGSVAPVIDLTDLMYAPQRQVSAPSGSAPSITQAKRLPYAIVVDDSLSARRALAQFVQDVGFEVRTAKDGLEAVSIIDERIPDILLVDLEMPRMNGLELTTHVRARETTQDLPVIMITSRSTDKHRQLANAAGVNVYLTKPYAEDELLHHIQTRLRERHEH